MRVFAKVLQFFQYLFSASTHRLHAPPEVLHQLRTQLHGWQGTVGAVQLPRVTPSVVLGDMGMLICVIGVMVMAAVRAVRIEAQNASMERHLSAV